MANLINTTTDIISIKRTIYDEDSRRKKKEAASKNKKTVAKFQFSEIHLKITVSFRTRYNTVLVMMVLNIAKATVLANRRRFQI